MGYNDWENSNIDNTLSPGERFLNALGKQFSYTPSPEEISKNISGIVGLGGIKPASSNVVKKPIGTGASGEWGIPYYNKDIGLGDEVPQRKAVLPTVTPRKPSMNRPSVLPQELIAPATDAVMPPVYPATSGIQPQIAREGQPQVDPKILEINKALEAIGMSRYRDPIWYRNVGIIHEDRLNKELSTLQPQPMTTAQQVLKDLDHILNPKFNPTNQIGGIESGDLAMAKMQDERAREEKYYNAAPKSIQQLMGPQQEARAPVGISLMDKGKVVQHQYMDVNPSRIPTPAERAFALKESYGPDVLGKSRVDAANVEIIPHNKAAQVAAERLNWDKESGKRNFESERLTVGIGNLITAAKKDGMDFNDPKEVTALNNAIQLFKNTTGVGAPTEGKQQTTATKQPQTNNKKIGLPQRIPTEAQIQQAMAANPGMTRNKVVKKMMYGGAE